MWYIVNSTKSKLLLKLTYTHTNLFNTDNKINKMRKREIADKIYNTNKICKNIYSIEEDKNNV